MNVLITGASAGIGFELAQIFAKEKASLILVARRRESLVEMQKDLVARFGISVDILVCDLSVPSETKKLAIKIDKQEILIDILVNNAGVGYFGEFLAELDTDVDQMVQLNVLSLTHLAGAAAKQMRARNLPGRILNVASVAGFVPGPQMAVYYATKAYVLSLSEALSEEFKSSSITVSCLCPGPTKTRFFQVAGMEDHEKFVKLSGVASAESVALAGYNGLMRGQVIIVPGFLNRTAIQSLRFIPRAIVRRTVAKFQKSRDH